MLKVATALPNEPYREYKDVERVYSGSTEIDKILDKNGNVLFAVNKEVEGTPALTYKGKEETNLKNYRIYGKTSRNLFDENTLISPIGSLSWHFDNHYLMSDSGGDGRIWAYDKSQFKFLLSSGTYRLSFDIPIIETTSIFSFFMCDDNDTEILFIDLKNRTSYSTSFTINNNTNIGIILKVPSNIKIRIMLNSGSTPLPYEPYGESVGDRTGNLFDKSGSQYGNNLHWVPTSGLVYSDAYYGSPIMDVTGLNTITRSYTGTGANYFLTSDLSQFVNVSNVGTVDAGVTVNVPDGYTKYVFNIPNTIRPDSIMVNSGSTPLPYEPYGYRVPVTVTNGTDMQTTNLYLPEQIKMVGDEAEYIDYGEQKQHRVRKNLLKNQGTGGTVNGVDFTINADKSIICNGTANALTFYQIPVTLDAGINYILNGAPETVNNAVRMDIRDYTSGVQVTGGDVGYGVSYIPSKSGLYKATIRIPSDFTCNNLTFYPMLRLASIEDDTYEPYIENTELDVTLPALPTLSGTNTLTVGTEVQPSSVYLKGRIKEVS